MDDGLKINYDLALNYIHFRYILNIKLVTNIPLKVHP